MFTRSLTAVLAVAFLAFGSQCAFANGSMLADRHGARALKCEMCHKTQPPKIVKTEDCLACHGSYEKLAERTDKNDINPHDSHVEDAACTDCHSGHKKPRLLCDQCHEFTNIKVP